MTIFSWLIDTTTNEYPYLLDHALIDTKYAGKNFGKNKLVINILKEHNLDKELLRIKSRAYNYYIRNFDSKAVALKKLNSIVFYLINCNLADKLDAIGVSCIITLLTKHREIILHTIKNEFKP